MRSVKHGRKKSVRYRYNISSAKRQNKKLKKLRKFKGWLVRHTYLPN